MIFRFKISSIFFRSIIWLIVFLILIFITDVEAIGNCQQASPAYIQENSGIIADGSFPFSPYIGSLDCLWVISPRDLGPTDKISVTFVTVELELLDKISIYDGTSVHERNLIKFIEGSSSFVNVLGKSGMPITINFKTTDSNIKLDGFTAVFDIKSYEELNPPKEEPPKEEPPKEEPPKEEPPKEEPPKEEPPKEEPPKEEPSKEEPPKEEPPKDNQSQNHSGKRDTPNAGILENLLEANQVKDTPYHNFLLNFVHGSVSDNLNIRKLRISEDRLLREDGHSDSLYKRSNNLSYCVNGCYESYGHGTCINNVCVCKSGFQGGDCHNDDVYILRQLYDKCSGESWKKSSKWDMLSETSDKNFKGPCALARDDKTPDFWYGVGACSSGRVVELNLSFNNLVCDDIKDQNAHKTLLDLLENADENDDSALVKYENRSYSILNDQLVNLVLKSEKPSDTDNEMKAKIAYWKIRDSQIYSPPLPIFSRKIDISGNTLKNIPLRIEKTSSLIAMNFANSAIKGNLPIELLQASFPSLSAVSLQNNRLAGDLLEDVAWVSGLSILDIENNLFEGFLTESILRIAQLNIKGNTIWCPAPKGFNGDCTRVSLNDVTPGKASMSGGDIIKLIGENLPQHAQVSCIFGDISVLAIMKDKESLQCKTPSHIPGITNLGLNYKSKKLAINTIPFTFTVECPQGSFIDIKTETKCLSCPQGGYCEGGKKYPISLRGYSDSPMNNETFQAFLPCFWPDSCIGNNTCAAGYDGPRCSSCVNGHVRSAEGCVSCGAKGTLYALIVMAWIFLMPIWWLRQAILGSMLSSFNIMITFFQIIGLFHQYPIVWQGYLKQLVSFTSLTVLNTDSLNLECALGLSFYGRLAFVWFLPIIFAIVCGMYVIWISYKQAERDNRIEHWKKYARKWRSFVINGSISALSLLQIPLTDRSLRMFTCIKDPNDNRYYIASSPDVTCFTLEYYIWRPLAFLATVIYGLGIPFWFFYIVYHNRNRLLNVKVFRRYGSLYSSYAIRAWYWPPFSTFWSMAFTFIPALFRRVETEFIFLSILMMYINLFATMYFQPFSFHRSNHLMNLSWSITIIFLISGLIMGWRSTTINVNNSSGIRQRDEDSKPPISPLPLGGSESVDTDFVITTIVTYLFIFNVIVLIHGMVIEWQQYNYELWKKRAYISRVVTNKVWLMVFPYDPTLRMEQVDNPLVSPMEIGLPNISYNDDFDDFEDDFGNDAPLPMSIFDPSDLSPAIINRDTFSNINTDITSVKKQKLTKKKGHGAKFLRVDNIGSSGQSPDGELTSDFSEVFDEDLDPDILDGFEDFNQRGVGNMAEIGGGDELFDYSSDLGETSNKL